MSVTVAQATTLLENVLFESPTLAAANAPGWASLSALNSSYATVTGLATAMASSPEAGIAEQVVRYYEGALGRAPSGPEVQYYVNIAETGLTPTQINNGTQSVSLAVWNIIAGDFANSPEFSFATAGSNVVELLYLNILGRSPSASEVAYYNAQLSAGFTATNLVQEFANSPEYIAKNGTQVQGSLASYGTSVTNGTTPDTLTPPTVTTPVTQPVNYTLTTGVDVLSGTGSTNNFYAVIGSSTSASLNTGDSLTGGGTTNTLNISDGDTGTAATLPGGITVTGIQTAIVNDAFHVGSGTSNTFDVSGFTGLTSLTVTSSGAGIDYIKAAATTNVVDTLSSSGASGDYITGGANVTVNAYGTGTITVKGATGAVTVTTNATNATSNETITVTTGSSITITNGGAGAITVGGGSVATDPTGAVTVTSLANGSVTVNGGTTVSVTGDNAITIGGTSAALSPSGAVTTIETDDTGTKYNTQIDGGVGVTATTNGGNVTIGSNVATTGAVSITDKNSLGGAANTDAFTVDGGSTVSVKGVNSAGAVAIGVAPGSLNSAGTAVANAASDPTGNVTVNLSSGSSYGTGSSTIYTNGATTVTLTGGDGAAITDIATTLNASGTAVGTSKLATLVLSNVGGTANVTSGAISSVTINDGTTTATTVNLSSAPSAALSITLNTGKAVATFTDDKATSVAITAAAGTNDTITTLHAVKATAITIADTAGVTISTLTLGTQAETITATGAGALTLGSTTALATSVTSVNASAETGAVTVTLNPAYTAFTGGSGADTVTITGAPAMTLNGGSGTSNTLILAASSTTFTPLLGGTSTYITGETGFQTLGLKMDGNAVGSYSASGFTGLLVTDIAKTGNFTETFTSVAANTPLAVTSAGNQAQTQADTVTYTLATAAATLTTNSLTLSIGKDGSHGSTGTDFTLDEANVATITVASASKSSSTVALTTYSNKVTISDTTSGAATLKTINISGDGNITLAAAGTASQVLTTVNASGSSGAVTITGIDGASTGLTITGGSGYLTANATNTATTGSDSFTTGSGGGAITVGNGNTATGTVTAGTGAEVVNLSASTAVADTITVNQSLRVAVTAFTVTGSTASADVLTYSDAAKTVVGNTTSTTGISSNTYTIANGIMSANGGTVSVSTELADALKIVSVAGVNSLVAFTNSGTTYVVSDGNDAGQNSTTVVQLAGVTGLTGVGSSAAAGSIDISNVTAASGTGVTTLAASNTQPEGGKIGVDSITLATGAANTASADTTSFTNLAASGTIVLTNTLTTTGNYVGNVTVTQSGTSGSESLTVELGTVASKGVETEVLTSTGDSFVVLSTGFGGAASVTGAVDSFVDSSNTVTTIIIKDGAATDYTFLTAYTSTSVTLIDAHAVQGEVEIGFASNNGTVATASALTNSNITIKASYSGTSLIDVSGSSDSITQAAQLGTAATGSVTVTAGAFDTVTLGNGTDDVTTGSGGTVSVGTGADLVTVGANSTVTIAAASTNQDTITVGANSTVTLSNGAGGGTAGDGIVVINQNSNLTGTTTSGSYVTTTINNAVHGVTEISFLDLNQGAVGAAINVTAQTTLAGALNLAATQASGTIAAGHGQLEWFQYGGNTWLVDAGPGTHTHGVTSVDTVVELVGQVTLSGATFGAGTGVLTI